MKIIYLLVKKILTILIDTIVDWFQRKKRWKWLVKTGILDWIEYNDPKKFFEICLKKFKYEIQFDWVLISFNPVIKSNLTIVDVVPLFIQHFND